MEVMSSLRATTATSSIIGAGVWGFSGISASGDGCGG